MKIVLITFGCLLYMFISLYMSRYMYRKLKDDVWAAETIAMLTVIALPLVLVGWGLSFPIRWFFKFIES